MWAIIRDLPGDLATRRGIHINDTDHKTAAELQADFYPHGLNTLETAE